jgi:uncharacterized protein YheU (UPF0270 family)
MIVPWNSLSRDALRGVIEDFVTREGTEYGAREVPLDAKVRQVLAQLEDGTVVIVYDSDRASVSIVPARELRS